MPLYHATGNQQILISYSLSLGWRSWYPSPKVVEVRPEFGFSISRYRIPLQWVAHTLKRNVVGLIPGTWVHACSVTQLCLTLCNPMNCSPPGSSGHGILDKNIGVDCHFLLQGSSLPRDRNHISCSSCIGRWILYHWASRKLRIWPQGLCRCNQVKMKSYWTRCNQVKMKSYWTRVGPKFNNLYLYKRKETETWIQRHTQKKIV